MKRSILVAALTVFVMSVSQIQDANAQWFRIARTCPTGTCPTITSYNRAYQPYSYYNAANIAAAAPCAAVETVEPCEPCETVAPCAPTETIEPCAPVQSCDTMAAAEYYPTTKDCDGRTCPIRTAVRATATAARNVAATARLLLAVNRVRAQYRLPALRADAALDNGSLSQASYCAAVGQLAHGSGAEILAYNYSGFDAAIMQWLNSPAHRSLLLGSFRAAGVAMVRGNDGRVWCAMRFR